MGLRIQNNIAALNAHRNLVVSDAGLAKSLERLSSGYRINRAADDAAGLAVSQGFRADIASYRAASRNVAEANSLLQVAEGAMDQINNMLTRLKELATQAASSNAGANVDKINAEGNALLLEIDRIANVTEYAGAKLLNGSFGVTASSGISSTLGLVGAANLQSGVTYSVTITSTAMTVSATLGSGQISQAITGLTLNQAQDINFNALGLTITVDENFSAGTTQIVASTATASEFQIGAKDTPDDRVGIMLSSVTTTALSLSSDQLLSATDAQPFLTSIDSAISTLNSTRGDIGAAQNRMGYAAANLASTIENITASESVIRDVDMAAEMITFTKNQILLQAGTAMLAQANLAPQVVLSLFG
jgi:flagellin